MARFAAFQDRSGAWRWRLIDGNNRQIATSGESFDSRSNALRAAANVKATAPAAVLPPRRVVRKASRQPTPLLSSMIDARRR